MPKLKLLLAAFLAIAVSLAGYLAYKHWHWNDSLAVRREMLARMPAEANILVFVDLQALRTSPFLTQ